MTAPSPSQLVLDLPLRQALGAEDFLVSASNAAAVELIDSWPGWPNAAVVVAGPRGSGKSHLAHVWQLKSGAPAVAADAISEAAIGELERARALVVEDADRGIADERILFHILNLAREKQLWVLVTSAAAPGAITVGLPDLRSRLRAMPLVTIEAPDEPLLRAVLVKLFADRQLTVEPHVVSYLALRMERSLEAAGRLVAAVDRLALERQSKVTRALAAEALASTGNSDDGA